MSDELLHQLLLCPVQVMSHGKPVMLHAPSRCHVCLCRKVHYCSAPASRTLFKDKTTVKDERIEQRCKMKAKYESTGRPKVLLYSWSSLGELDRSEPFFPLLTSRGRHPDSTGLIIQPFLRACCQDNWRKKSRAEIFTLRIGRTPKIYIYFTFQTSWNTPLGKTIKCLNFKGVS